MFQTQTIGKKIIMGRKQANLTQAELAKQLSISAQAVGKWERGESLPDIGMLQKISDIFKVDLNYFSESNVEPKQEIIREPIETASLVNIKNNSFKKKAEWHWDMSKGNWSDADFSGIKQVKELFSSSNMKNCAFKQSDLSELVLAKNNIELCDFSDSDLRNSKMQSSNVLKCKFNKASFIDAVLYKSNIERCDFSFANFSGTEIIECNIEHCILHEAVWNYSLFKHSNISYATFSGNMDNCHFEQCSFYHVTFENAIIQNSFFKYNDRFKKVQFINCQVDAITYAFLKNNQATLTGITLMS